MANDNSTPYASIIGGGSSIIGGLIDRGTAERENRKARDYGREMAEYAYTKDLEMWERENQYNSPTEQMKRLKDAGLNPNLMYGQGNTGNAGAGPSYQKPEGAFGLPEMNLAEAVSIFQDLRQKQAQTDNIRKQSLLLDKELTGKTIDNVRKAFDLGEDYDSDMIGDDWSWEEKANNARVIRENQNRPSQKAYQFEANKAEIEAKNKNLADKMQAEKELAELARDMARKEKELYEETGGDRLLSKDAYEDRLMYKMFGKGGTGAKAGLTFLMMLKGLGK